ncbi:hypothetical protein MSG28_010082 [Choristoneura fumiferana]|uniref:Uncharacterized protein n=2 Tax=Choristoneura fumiferana TaxID=7141 RepID=A0ACC0KJS1_CHOFU|nr:hypothetical protein MSG28_010082 [Choristoneura fumiferana]
MVYATENLGLSTLSNRKTVVALEVTLNQSLCNLKDLVLEFEQLHMEVIAQKEKCERKACVGSEALKKVIEIKDNIIQSVASALTMLSETKNMNLIHEAFKILCGETVSLTSPKEKLETNRITPKKEVFSEITDVLNNESVSEIDGTPTGRTSPVILSKKYRNATASDSREKKKCPDNWPISENKTLKLSFSTPVKAKSGSKLRQARFTFVKQKSIVDLTSSPAFSGGSKGFKDSVNCLQLDIKKETFDDEDTIQPSPTSTTASFPGL